MGNITSDPGDTHPEAKPGPQDVVANRILEVLLNQAVWQRLPRLWLKGNSQTYRWQALRPKTEPLDSCEFSGDSTDWEEWMEHTWLILNPMLIELSRHCGLPLQLSNQSLRAQLRWDDALVSVEILPGQSLHEARLIFHYPEITEDCHQPGETS